MIIKPANFDPQLIHGPADLMGQVRSGGLHLSDIYHSLEEELTTKKREPMPLSMLQVYRSAGFICENAMNKAFADALTTDTWIRPEEWERDGVKCSPDLINVNDWILGETKFTWKSSKHIETMKDGTGPLWIWLVQMKGYCYVIGTQHARLWAFFVNGDYRNMQPQLHVLDITFTELELRENWNMLLNHARRNGWLSSNKQVALSPKR